jgi:hypothetical protein
LRGFFFFGFGFGAGAARAAFGFGFFDVAGWSRFSSSSALQREGGCN